MMMRYAMIALVVLLVHGLVPPAGGAQSLDRMDRRLKELETQVKELRLLVTKPGTAALRRDEGARPEDGNSSDLLARMTVRLQELESEMADLRGQIEELGHRVRQNEKAFNTFREDVEFRFQSLQGGAAQAGGEKAQEGETVDTAAARAAAEEAGGEALAPPGDDGTGAAGPAPESSALPKGTAQERYDYAYGLLRRGDFAKAERALRAFVEQHGDHDLAGNAQYWLGETFYARQRFADAAKAFLRGFRDYSAGAKGPDSLLKLGLSLANLGNTDRACDSLAEIPRAFPDAPDRIKRRAEQERARLGC